MGQLEWCGSTSEREVLAEKGSDEVVSGPGIASKPAVSLGCGSPLPVRHRRYISELVTAQLISPVGLQEEFHLQTRLTLLLDPSGSRKKLNGPVFNLDPEIPKRNTTEQWMLGVQADCQPFPTAGGLSRAHPLESHQQGRQPMSGKEQLESRIAVEATMRTGARRAFQYNR